MDVVDGQIAINLSQLVKQVIGKRDTDLIGCHDSPSSILVVAESRRGGEFLSDPPVDQQIESFVTLVAASTNGYPCSIIGVIIKMEIAVSIQPFAAAQSRFNAVRS